VTRTSRFVATLAAAAARRNELIDDDVTGGVRVAADDMGMLQAFSGEITDSRFLGHASSQPPTVAPGAATVRRLGISDVDAAPTAPDDHPVLT
jgi:hypothetical protein